MSATGVSLNLLNYLEGKTYDVILMDPPWKYDESERTSFNQAAPTYPLMDLNQICSLPIDKISKEDSLLWLWTTKDFRCEATAMMETWGFEFKTEYVWVKQNYEGNLQIGTGHYNRLCHEILYLGIKGKHRPINANNEPSVIFGIRRDHSQKPEESYRLIDRNSAKGWTKLELFARVKRQGWDAWGNEIPQYGSVENIW